MPTDALWYSNNVLYHKVVKVYHVTMLQCSQSLSRDKLLEVSRHSE